MSKLLTFVQGRFANRQTMEIMEAHPSGLFTPCNTISAADVVVWTGGEDIDPTIYNSKLIPGTYINKHRDADDLLAVAMADGKIKIGICRGAQLLNCVPNGGTLWQDVDGHELGMHGEHVCTDYLTTKHVRLNSVHHQMMRPTDKGIVICGNYKAMEKHTYESVWKRMGPSHGDNDLVDPEAVWYPDTKSLCYQPHPEFGHKPTTDYFYELIDRFILTEKETIHCAA